MSASPVDPAACAAVPEPTTAAAKSRQKRGIALAAVAPLRTDASGRRYRVPSQSGRGSYLVECDPATGWRCECKDFEDRGEPCKHVYAVQARLQREREGTAPDPSAAITPPRPTYKQDWPAYNAAQIHEKAKFLELLADLCRGVAEPARPHDGTKGGRPPVPLRDRAFAVAFKVYTTRSGRRASTDMRDARDKGHLSCVPHYTRVSRFLEDAELTPVLRALIVASARPLASVEQDFA